MTGVIVLVLRLIATAILFAFAGYAFWIMWQEIRRTAAASSTKSIPPLRLEIKGRSQSPIKRSFAQPEVLLGRDPRSDVLISDKVVSARHALLSYHDGQWWADDLGSTNGTRLNGQLLEQSTVLMTGDELRCGSVRLVVRLPNRNDQNHVHRRGRDD